MPVNFSEISRRREAMGMTQAKMTVELNKLNCKMHRSNLARIEAKTSGGINIEMLQAIAKVLNCNVDELLMESDAKTN